MSRDIITRHITATGVGTDTDTTYKALAQNAAQQIKDFLAPNLLGFSYVSTTLDATSSYLPYWVKFTSKDWNCDLSIAATAKGLTHSYGTSSLSYGLGFQIKLEQNGVRVYSLAFDGGSKAVTDGSGNNVSTDFDIRMYHIEDIMFSIGFDFHNVGVNSGQVFGIVSFASFKGSYDDKVYVGYKDDSSRTKGISLPTEMKTWYSDGVSADITFSYTGTANYPTGYYLRPYCWFAHYTNHNCGLALFGGKYVLYQLYSNDLGEAVTTTPEETYTINGEAVPAISTTLMLLASSPYRKLQKPGEVLTW